MHPACAGTTSTIPPPGVKETDTGLAPPNLWDLQADKMMMQEEQPLQVRCRSHARHRRFQTCPG